MLQDKPGHVLFDHGPPQAPRVRAMATLNTFAYAPPGSPGKRHTYQETWAGTKHNDLKVRLPAADVRRKSVEQMSDCPL